VSGDTESIASSAFVVVSRATSKLFNIIIIIWA
jgi:hypothetical protein